VRTRDGSPVSGSKATMKPSKETAGCPPMSEAGCTLSALACICVRSAVCEARRDSRCVVARR
jgi:hypothetical protein